MRGITHGSGLVPRPTISNSLVFVRRSDGVVTGESPDLTSHALLDATQMKRHQRLTESDHRP